MQLRSVLLFLPLVALLYGISVRAADAPDVRALMTPEEYQAAGIDKLSGAEVEALNRWLLRYTAKEAPVMRQQSAAVKQEIEKIDNEVIHTQIAGEFRGWSGETVFRLRNGQVWKQRTPGNLFFRAVDPDVELRKNFMGFWEMRVVARDRAVGVKLMN